MAIVNPPPLKLPKVDNRELTNYLKQVQSSIYQMWSLFGAGTGLVAVSFGGTGAQTAEGARDNLGLEIGVDVQAYSLTLDELSGTTTAAYGRGLLAATSEANFKALVNLEIGTDVQAYDAGLQSIAGLTPSADQMLYATGSNVYAVTTLTAFARTLLDDADAAAARNTIGLGSTASPQFNYVLLVSNTPASATAPGAAGAISWDADYVYVCTATDTWKRVGIATW